MKIFSTEQIRDADAYTIHHEPISSIDLMERASLAFVTQFEKWFDLPNQVVICCGRGNNGGDGLAIARILHQQNYPIQVVIFYAKTSGSLDFESNLKRLPEAIKPVVIKTVDDLPEFRPNSVVIDAIFGSGLSRSIEGVYAEVIAKINASDTIKVAVDIASGLMADQVTLGKAIVKADFTISFQFAKRAFLLPENDPYVGHWTVVPIGLSPQFIDQTPTDSYLITREEVAKKLKPRNKYSHKGNYGKVLIMAGSHGKIGASILSNKACLRTGTGLLTASVPASGNSILQIAVPEVMTVIDPEPHFIATLPALNSYNAVGIGPGIGTHDLTAAVLFELLTSINVPLVIDADAITILGKNKNWLEKLPPGTILTPHVKEFERIAGSWNNGYERIQLQQSFSKKYQVIIIFKGAHTTVSSTEGKCYFNTTGNPGMATAGSGDVLTGIITSLLGQGYKPIEAATIGVYLHGLAGDCAAEALGQNALMASDIIDNIGQAYTALSS